MQDILSVTGYMNRLNHRLWAGRLLAIDEQVANQPSQIRERVIYAPATPESQAYNLCVKSFVTMVPPAVNNKVLPFKDIFKFSNASYC